MHQRERRRGEQDGRPRLAEKRSQERQEQPPEKKFLGHRCHEPGADGIRGAQPGRRVLLQQPQQRMRTMLFVEVLQRPFHRPVEQKNRRQKTVTSTVQKR